MNRWAPERLNNLTRGTSMSTRLPAAVVVVSLLSLLAATLVGLTTGRSLGEDLTDDRLTALRSSGAFDIAAQMRSLVSTTDALAASPQAVIALDSFAEAHAELADTPAGDLKDEIKSVVLAYRDDYIDPLLTAGREVDFRDIVTDNTAAIYLQYHYAVNLGVIDEPAAVDDALDGSEWSELHAVVHPIYRDIVDRLELFDLYLVEPESGVVVYSVNKRPDIGTSLVTGPFSGSFLAGLVDRVLDDPSAGAAISDLSFYDAALLTPVGAVASPVMDGDRVAGVMVLMYDSSRITDVLTADGNWDDGGFPPTGDSYLIGKDGFVRSDPRSFLEDPQAHVRESVEAGVLSEEDRTAIEATGTTVLSQPVIGETVDAAVDGDQSVGERRTMVGGRAFSTVEAVDIEGLGWSVVTEVAVEVAEGDLDDFTELLVVGTAVFIIAVSFLAVAWAGRIVRPLRAVSERLGSRGAELGPIDVSAKTPIEFRQLAESFEAMSVALENQQGQLADAREERLRLLRRMLPPDVADRVAAGELQSVEEVPQASVVVVVVVGLAELVRTDGSGSGRELVDRLHGELDELAERHGVARVKVIGDAYFAACGHGRPYIDHAPRAVMFAGDARDAIQEIGSDLPEGLDVAVGVHTGAVTVGVNGGRRLLYDVWGAPVTVAHHLARRASRGQILLSDETAVLLPDDIELTRPPGLGDSMWIVDSVSVRGTT